MNIWLIASFVLLLFLLMPVLVALRREPIDGLVALALGGLLATLALVTIGVASGRPDYLDLALAAALVSFAGTIAYAHFLERWL